MKASRDMFLCMAVFVGLCGMAHCGAGCAEFNGATATPAELYKTEIIACAQTSGYPGAYDHDADMRCRNEVNCRWGLPSCSRAPNAVR